MLLVNASVQAAGKPAAEPGESHHGKWSVHRLLLSQIRLQGHLRMHTCLDQPDIDIDDLLKKCRHLMAVQQRFCSRASMQSMKGLPCGTASGT